MKFKVGQTYTNTCWFTGGQHTYTVKSRTENKVTFDSTYAELDGIHHNTETFDIHTDKHGNEYVVLYEYHEAENRIWAID
jgi:hypothetical protein